MSWAHCNAFLVIKRGMKKKRNEIKEKPAYFFINPLSSLQKQFWMSFMRRKTFSMRGGKGQLRPNLRVDHLGWVSSKSKRQLMGNKVHICVSLLLNNVIRYFPFITSIMIRSSIILDHILMIDGQCLDSLYMYKRRNQFLF